MSFHGECDIEMLLLVGFSFGCRPYQLSSKSTMS